MDVNQTLPSIAFGNTRLPMSMVRKITLYIESILAYLRFHHREY